MSQISDFRDVHDSIQEFVTYSSQECHLSVKISCNQSLSGQSINISVCHTEHNHQRLNQRITDAIIKHACCGN